MNFNQQSIHAKLYREFYSTEVLPDNLCPFFWGLLFAWICAPFYFIFGLPIKRDWIWGRIVKWILFISVAIIALGCAVIFVYANYHLVRYWLNCYSYNNDMAWLGGFLDLYFSGVILINYIKRKLSKKKRHSILIEFVKAKYGKYCPQINWE